MFEPLPTLIREERERQGLSQLGLANLAGVGRTTLIALERGEDNISLGAVVKVARALNLRMLHIGDLEVVPASPDLRVLLLAREAIAAAQKVIDQAAASHEDLGGLSASVSDLLHQAFEPAHVPDVGVARAAARLASRPEQATARALRDLAETAHRIPRSSAQPKPGTKKTARSRGR